MRAGGGEKPTDEAEGVMLEVIVEFEAEAFSTEAGEGVADCGATLSCMGDETWEAWLAAMGKTADDWSSST